MEKILTIPKECLGSEAFCPFCGGKIELGKPGDEHCVECGAYIASVLEREEEDHIHILFRKKAVSEARTMNLANVRR